MCRLVLLLGPIDGLVVVNFVSGDTKNGGHTSRKFTNEFYSAEDSGNPG